MKQRKRGHLNKLWKPALDKFWEKIAISDGCWLWTATAHPDGYGQFRIHENDKRLYAHHFMWEITYGPIPNGLWVLHRCDNPRCVRPEHLFLGTHTDNMRDCVSKRRHGRWTKPHRTARGERVNTARLVEAQVKQIRELHGPGMGYKRLAKLFGVDRATVREAVLRMSWRHVP